VKPLLALALLVGCSFSSEVPGEEATEVDGGVMPTASTRCVAEKLALCVDFEDMPAPRDGIAPEATISAANITQRTRLEEFSAEWVPASQLRIAEASKLDIGQTLTIEMWTKPTATPPDSGDEQFGLFETHLQYQMNFKRDRKIECVIQNTLGTDTIESEGSVALDAWHHVACTYDGAMLKVYVDGKLRGCRAATRTVSTFGTLGAAIGANMLVGPVYKNPFVGELDNVHVYARTLPATEICTLWGNGACDDRCPPGGNGGQGPGGGP
jgi:Concanavalin A-like lectin/glucanases superfamily